MYHKIIILAYLLLCLPFTGVGQTKYERESRLKTSKVPPEARQFVDSLRFQKKAKWYFEENLQGNSIEAKVCNNKKQYSIEFDTLGRIQDIEIQLNWSEVPQKTRTRITAALDSLYVKHKIQKIQIQYAGDRDGLFQLVQNQTACNACTTRYELVVKGSKPGDVQLYEITVSDQGDVLTIEQIIFRNTDNLEY